MDDILACDAADLAGMLARKELSAEELMRATLARIETVNPQVNALVSLRDAGVLLAEARAADNGPAEGPLHGMPIAVKDLFDVAGLPTVNGSPLLGKTPARQDSPHVARLRAAGAIIIGKTNTPEFCIGSHTYNPVFGATRNPYAPDRSCGGSSGGAAVALSTGMLALADGSDMMGSLRNPAGWNNVYGFRPTWGRVPGARAGDLYLHPISANGPMARSPRDLGLLLDVISGPDPDQPFGRAEGPVGPVEPAASGARIGWLGDWGGAWPMEDGILPLCRAALEMLAQDGARIEDLAPPIPRETLWNSWTTLRSFGLNAGLGALYDDPESRDALKPEAIWEIERGRALSAQEVQNASTQRSDWYRRALELFETCDAVALPTAQVWPFPVDLTWPREVAGHEMDTYHRWMEVVVPASLIGLPALAMPAGFSDAGLPMGVQLIGRPGSEARLLSLAEAYHRATRWPQTRPPVLQGL
ncbi:amidase [Roseovarius aestuariivivens]|uniref:amidase n=1 Tax=Roseovarius aestuariivivens TaxID=1888910 RepID=UPI0010814EEE|nr:amidase [Roseovarius aestuariivivens]